MVRGSEEQSSVPASIKPELRVGFVLMNHFTLVPVAGLVDSLRFAADKSFRSQQVFCQWDWMTLNDQPIVASCGMPISPTKPLNLWAQYDYIVIAGGCSERRATRRTGCSTRYGMCMLPIFRSSRCAPVLSCWARRGCWMAGAVRCISPCEKNSRSASRCPLR